MGKRTGIPSAGCTWDPEAFKLLLGLTIPYSGKNKTAEGEQGTVVCFVWDPLVHAWFRYGQ